VKQLTLLRLLIGFVAVCLHLLSRLSVVSFGTTVQRVWA